MTTPTHNQNILIESRFVQKLLDTTKSIEEDFMVTSGAIIRSFFDFLKHKKRIHIIEGMDFGKMDNQAKLEELEALLREKHATCKHKYKKLHYLYVISRIKDRIHELQYNKGFPLTHIQKINYILKPADVGLIEYTGKKVTLSSVLGNIFSRLLQYFSGSIFCHIGLVGHKTDTWFDWLHSTGHKRYNQWEWVEKASLFPYIKKIWSCELLITRYENITPEETEKIIESGMKLAKTRTWYDIGDAIGDLTGIHLLRSENKVNCWEFVYKCLKTINIHLDSKWRSIPGEYLKDKDLKQQYLISLKSID